jgi:hypothetical protein
MTGKSFRKIGRDKQSEQHKKSAYMGRRRFGREFGLLAGSKEGKVLESRMLTGVFMARRTWAGEQEMQRECLEQR